MRWFAFCLVFLLLAGCDSAQEDLVRVPFYITPLITGIEGRSELNNPTKNYWNPSSRTEGQTGQAFFQVGAPYPNPVLGPTILSVRLSRRVSNLHVWIVRGYGPGEDVPTENGAVQGGAFAAKVPYIPPEQYLIRGEQPYGEGVYQITIDTKELGLSPGFYRVYVLTEYGVQWRDLWVIESFSVLFG